jgi:hypothetical protein
VYVNNTPIGKGADNKRLADVQLIQLLLRSFYIATPGLYKKVAKPSGRRVPVPAILLDGIVGDQTKTGITVFQQFIKDNAGQVVVDGLVSVPRGGLNVAGTSNVFTIIHLNNSFFAEPENAAFNSNLQDHPVVNASLPALAAELRGKKAAA